jgi:tetratricopeptide (TPR) repeat protein
MQLNQQRDEHEAVRHLIELGYVDPREVMLREAAVRRQLEAELQAAMTATKQGRLAKAVALLERLKVDDPNWIAPHQLLAEIYYRSGRFGEAQVEIVWLENHGVENPRLSLLSAGIAIIHRDFAGALELLEYAAHVEPALPSVHSTHGNVLLRLGKVEWAHEAFERALVQNADDAYALDGMSAICLIQGGFEAAADWALRALEKNMQFFRAHYHLGVALLNLKRPAEAITAFEASSRTDPSRVAPYHWMSHIAAHQFQDPERAEHYLAQGRQLLQQHRERRASTLT